MNIQEAYSTGTVQFMGVEIGVAPGALVPREETELLGRVASAELETLSPPPRLIVDMCCGSGNLACALAIRYPQVQVWASDVTAECVDLARNNVSHLGLAERVCVLQGDLFSSLAGRGLEGAIDMVVCNPPYISQARLVGDSADLLLNEPREAFDGGPYGLSIHQRVIRECLAFLRPGGALLFEIGLGQEKQVKILFGRSRTFTEVQFASDAAGNPRVVYARRNPA